MRKWWILLAGLLLLAACTEDNAILLNEQAMVNITDGRMVTDNGLTYQVAEDHTNAGWKTLKRAWIRCDVLRQRSATEFDIALQEARSCLLKDPVRSGSVDPGSLGDDPVLPREGWFSNGLLNLLVQLAYVPSSDNPPNVFNLLFDEQERTADTLRFELRLNSSGRYYGAPGHETLGDDLSVAATYCSFPVLGFLPEGKDEAVVRITSRWYKSDVDGQLLPETETVTRTGKLRR